MVFLPCRLRPWLKDKMFQACSSAVNLHLFWQCLKKFFSPSQIKGTAKRNEQAHTHEDNAAICIELKDTIDWC